MDAALPTIKSLLSTSATPLGLVATSSRWRRQVGGDMPVVFLPEESDLECLPSNRMSSFGFLAFVVQSINAVVNVANNINRERGQIVNRGEFVPFSNQVTRIYRVNNFISLYWYFDPNSPATTIIGKVEYVLQADLNTTVMQE